MHGVVPLAERLDIPEFDLWRLGDIYGKWVLPSQQTLNHLIAQSVIKHFLNSLGKRVLVVVSVIVVVNVIISVVVMARRQRRIGYVGL